MDRTKAANYVDIGGGRRGFRNRDLANGLRGTTHDAADRNSVQEEMLAIIEAAGLVPDANDWTQVLKALRLLFGHAITVYAAPGTYTYTVPAGATRLRVRLCGGGASGGWGTAGMGGEGGSAGGYAEEIAAVTPGQKITVTVGAGGAAPGSSGAKGLGGGSSSFGAICSASGGGAAPSLGAGGVSGAGSGGDVNVTGGNGGDGTSGSTMGGGGGASAFGGGGRAGTAGGSPGQAPGSGGGGSYGGAAGQSGAGADGIVIVEALA